MSQIQKMTAQATAITAAMTISLTRQRRFGFFASAWVDAWEAGVAFCDIGGPSVVGKECPLPLIGQGIEKKFDSLRRY